MYATVAVSGYRSLRDVVLPLGNLTVITGANGSGKSSVYRALRLLGACGRGEVVRALAQEGGLESALWAGPESLAQARRGHEVQGTMRSGPIAIRLGVGGVEGELSYLTDLGIPVQAEGTRFNRDPEIKREAVWHGPVMRPSTLVARRKHSRVEVRENGGWEQAPARLPPWSSMLTELVDPLGMPEPWAVREALRTWRFYDGFRVDAQAPARRPQVGTRTWALAEDGADVAAALQTIREDDGSPLAAAVADAFDGATLDVVATDGLFDIALHQPGMLRPLRSAELSDGTLRYLLWLAALLTPVPPRLLALNEPETSLHPSLVPPLARAIATASRRTQVVVVTHAQPLVDALADAVREQRDLDEDPRDLEPEPGELLPLRLHELTKDLGETLAAGQGLLTTPSWEWGRR
ncbi:putative RecF protein [Serinicoccus hydrothermalis]|uniref:Putative RecF protein n=1 Tax=Serinicoccus hydrothermalis TaxID=1758689 RepID=A0A1B1NDQ1_9MICO|nr:AAA family ATPase [Serinicoccus hydrothermalis]ANS79546.1 putative RecF protein [Serinicoccus hydrothermalis]